VSVLGISVGADAAEGVGGTVVDGEKVGKLGSGVGVEGCGVPSAVHATAGSIKMIRYRFIN
jgi:hypothetical protein